MMKTELVAQNGLACTRGSHEKVASPLKEATVQDAIQPLDTAWDTLRHRNLICSVGHERALLALQLLGHLPGTGLFYHVPIHSTNALFLLILGFTASTQCAILYSRRVLKFCVFGEKIVKSRYYRMQYCSCPGVRRGNAGSSDL